MKKTDKEVKELLSWIGCIVWASICINLAYWEHINGNVTMAMLFLAPGVFFPLFVIVSMLWMIHINQ